MSAIYPIGSPIPLFFIRNRNGNLISGLSVRVRVLNALSGSLLLPSMPLTEVTPGIYSLMWWNQITSLTECVEIYTVAGKDYPGSFTVGDIGSGGGGSVSPTIPCISLGVIMATQTLKVLIKAPEMNVALSTEDVLQASVIGQQGAKVGISTPRLNIDLDAQELDINLGCRGDE